jgi:signal transduction histidine kinase
MRSFKDFAINTKLSLLVLLSSGVALICASLCFVINDVVMIRLSLVRQTSALAEVLAENSTAALTFQDQDSAQELLRSLQQQPDIVWARIYTADGKPFATYHQKNVAYEPLPEALVSGHVFRPRYLNVVRDIGHKGEPIGTIFLRTSLDELYGQLIRYVAIVAVMIAVSMAVSIALSSRFQRVISAPIVNLAKAAQNVSRRRDYSIRVEKTSSDELGDLYDQFNAMLEEIQKGEAAIQRANDDLEMKIEDRTTELSNANKNLSHQIAIRKQAELELENVHQRLMDAARHAGMAEIATGVLHNVGNVLNSINVSATLVADRMRHSKVVDLVRAVKLIEAHSTDLGTYLTKDAKGKQLPPFLGLLATHLSEERADIASELEQLTTKVNHVKAIVSTQQTYAGVSGIIEAVDLSGTLDDALRLNLLSFERHKIKVVKDFQEFPKVRIDKQKVLQILVNLIKNAKEAFADAANKSGREVVIATRLSREDALQISVRDNGIGIRREDLTRVFTHGFTTKDHGHGFGLHSCAIAAHELGGSLVVKSEGIEQGATFTLTIPYHPVKTTVALPV